MKGQHPTYMAPQRWVPGLIREFFLGHSPGYSLVANQKWSKSMCEPVISSSAYCGLLVGIVDKQLLFFGSVRTSKRIN